MKYVVRDMGEAAEINSGGVNHWTEMVKLFSMALLLLIGLYLATVFITEYIVSGISVETEKKWFGKMEMLVDEPVNKSDSKEDIAMAKRVLDRLTQHPDVPALNYRVIEIDSEELNAFAFPGGTIGITTGLLAKVKGETGLAFVIGHELGHFKYRHHLKAVSKAFGLSVILTIVFGGDNNLALSQNIITVLDAKHSQKQELDSDAFGAHLVLETFDNTENIDEFLQLLQEKDASAIGFLSTHPSSNKRIEQLRKILLNFDAKS